MLLQPKLSILSVFAGLFLLFISSCERKDKSMLVSDKQKLILKIDSMERAMRNLPPTTPEDVTIEAGMYLASGLQKYTVNYPADTLSAEYSFRIAQLYDLVFKDKATALEYYYQVYQRYKWFKKQDEVLFLIANIYYDANRYDRAEMVFSRLQEFYPESAYAKEAGQFITLMKTDSSLSATAKRFEKLNADSTKKNP